MKVPASRPPACVDVFVTVAAATQPEDVTCPAGLDRFACFARHRIEWCAAIAGPEGRSTWHFRAPDAESVRLALRHAGIRVDTLRITHPQRTWLNSPPVVDIDVRS